MQQARGSKDVAEGEHLWDSRDLWFQAGHGYYHVGMRADSDTEFVSKSIVWTGPRGVVLCKLVSILRLLLTFIAFSYIYSWTLPLLVSDTSLTIHCISNDLLPFFFFFLKTALVHQTLQKDIRIFQTARILATYLKTRLERVSIRECSKPSVLILGWCCRIGH